uniref:RNA-directed DNA polymerase n=1 Tax=Heliothis virescens TaxID=7102 RepID=A0A2A4JT09_HELVI
MVYGLLQRRIREKVARTSFGTFAELVAEARRVEDILDEGRVGRAPQLLRLSRLPPPPLLRLRSLDRRPLLLRPGLIREQRPDESTDIFVCHVRALIAQLPPSSLSEVVQLDMVYGLLQRRIREKVARTSFGTFAELVAEARRVEDILDEGRPRPAAAEVKPLTSAAATPSSFARSPASVTKARPHCNYCEQFGHLKEACQKLVKQKAAVVKEKASSAPASTPTITCFGCGTTGVIRSNCSTCKEKKSVVSSSVFQSVSASDTRLDSRVRPVLEVEVYGVTGRLVLDTGAKHCIGSVSLRAHLVSNGQTFSNVFTELKYADGRVCAQNVEIAQVKVTVRGVTLNVSFLMLPNAKDSLLGMNFIRDAGMVLDFCRRGGPTDFAVHRIDTGDATPIASPPYRVSPAKKEIIIEPDLVKVQAVIDMKPPSNVKQLKTFLQTCSWFRKFIPQFSEVARPLTYLTKKDRRWRWGESEQNAFEELKVRLSTRGGPTDFAVHRIDTGDATPIASLKPESPAKKEIIIKPDPLDDPDVCKIIKDFENSDSPDSVLRWTDRGYYLSQGELYRCYSNGESVVDKGRRVGTRYTVGDLVLVESHRLSQASKGFTSMFAPRREGPYTIKSVVSPTTFEVVDKNDLPRGRYYSSLLNPYVGSGEAVVHTRRRGRPRKVIGSKSVPEPSTDLEGEDVARHSLDKSNLGIAPRSKRVVATRRPKDAHDLVLTGARRVLRPRRPPALRDVPSGEAVVHTRRRGRPRKVIGSKSVPEPSTDLEGEDVARHSLDKPNIGNRPALQASRRHSAPERRARSGSNRPCAMCRGSVSV